MKAIILAAGYATRLFPLTQNFPKPLIPINNKPMINYIIDKLLEIKINDIYVISNNKYFNHFQNRANNNYKQNQINIQIINDKTYSNDDRLWAIWDIQYTIQQTNISDNIIVIWWDNLFQFSLQESYNLFLEKQKTTIIWYDVQNLELAKKYWIISIDNTNKVTKFVEKPQNPESTLAAICVYYYPKYILPQIEEYLSQWNNPDAPGNFPARLINKDDVYAQIHNKHRYDVGWFESLKSAKEDFGEQNINIEELKSLIL